MSNGAGRTTRSGARRVAPLIVGAVVLADQLTKAWVVANHSDAPLCDRIFRSPGVLRGHVVDFVRVGSFPSFNVADSAITIGAILLIVLSFRKPEPDPGPDAGPEPVA